MNNELKRIWQSINTEQRIFFLMDESTQLIWAFRKNGDKNSLEDFKERLEAALSFADIELREMEIKNKIMALLTADVNSDTADEFAELAREIRIGYGNARHCA